MRKMAYQHLFGMNPANVAGLVGKADVFMASVINQKVVNQNAQQVLAVIAAQVLNVIEAQFGFATNEDQDQICT